MDNKGALNTTSAVDTSNDYGDQVMESVSDVFAESRFYDYTLDKYSQDVEKRGLSSIWKLICDFVLKHGETKGLLQIKNFGELYEIGLAAQDKNKKKKNGQYFTPDDVALLMSKWLRKEEGTNVCDVGCGTGRLILTYLSLLGYDEARKLISSGNLYLYDLDSTALMICKTSIAVIYGVDILSSIHGIVGDFLSDIIHLPSDSKVISNPPYAPIDGIGENWADEDGVIKESMELYSAFMDKEFRESKSTVIITPFSFISSPKFQNLRYAMCQMGNGFIVAFDNVPGNIFCGKKKGIFNTNTANSVRASITVFRKNNNLKGFRVTHLIRFKGKERKNLLIPEKLESYLSTEYQIVDSEHPMFKKVDKRLETLYSAWIEKSHETMESLIDEQGDLVLSMPNTCRYFTSAANKMMNRNGQIVLRFSDIDKFSYVYCMINSSFVYWHWRIYDGGITYPKKLLVNMPVFYSILTEEDKEFFRNTAGEMISVSQQYIVTKSNVGVQENIKFPRQYRDKINKKIISILGVDQDVKDLDVIHSNTALEVNV